MFYDKYIEFCNRIGKTPSAVAKELGFSEASVTGWKKGSRPRDANLQKIADYFGVPVDSFTDSKTGTKALSTEAEKISKAATPEGSGLTDEFARIFAQLTPENQNRIIAEMLKRQRNQ